MATCSLPLFLIAIVSLSYFMDFANQTSATSLHDKLDIASLVIDNAEIGLPNDCEDLIIIDMPERAHQREHRADGNRHTEDNTAHALEPRALTKPVQQ